MNARTTFKEGQTVLVYAVIPRPHEDSVSIDEPTYGRVVRLLSRDDSAWVRLEKRLPDSRLHPFPAEDTRGCDVLAWPSDCDLVRQP